MTLYAYGGYMEFSDAGMFYAIAAARPGVSLDEVEFRWYFLVAPLLKIEPNHQQPLHSKPGIHLHEADEALEQQSRADQQKGT